MDHPVHRPRSPMIEYSPINEDSEYFESPPRAQAARRKSTFASKGRMLHDGSSSKRRLSIELCSSCLWGSHLRSAPFGAADAHALCTTEPITDGHYSYDPFLVDSPFYKCTAAVTAGLFGVLPSAAEPNIDPRAPLGSDDHSSSKRYSVAAQEKRAAQAFNARNKDSSQPMTTTPSADSNEVSLEGPSNARPWAIIKQMVTDEEDPFTMDQIATDASGMNGKITLQQGTEPPASKEPGAELSRINRSMNLLEYEGETAAVPVLEPGGVPQLSSGSMKVIPNGGKALLRGVDVYGEESPLYDPSGWDRVMERQAVTRRLSPWSTMLDQDDFMSNSAPSARPHY